MDIRTVQRPLKEKYRQNPASSLITLKARGSQTDAPISCSVDLGREIYKAQAHKGVGGTGTGLLRRFAAGCDSGYAHRSLAKWWRPPWAYLRRPSTLRSKAISTCRARWEFRKKWRSISGY